MDVLDQVLDIVVVGIVAILAGVIPLLTRYAIVWVKAKIELAAAELEATKPQLWQVIQIGAEIAVKSAEQMGLQERVEDKFHYAFEILQSWLADQGIEADVTVLEAAIEAAVKDEFPHKEG